METLNEYRTSRLEHNIHDKNAFGLELDVDNSDLGSDLLSEVKNVLRVRHDEDDTDIVRHINTAVTAVEGYVHRATIQREHVAYWRKAYQWVELPRPPVQSITEVVRIDSDGNETTIDASDYDIKGRKAYKLILDSISNDALRVTYQAGYGDNLTDLPQGLYNAIIEQVPVYYQKARPQGGIEVDPASRLSISSMTSAQPFKYYYNL